VREAWTALGDVQRGIMPDRAGGKGKADAVSEPIERIWYTPEMLKILEANMKPWVFAVAFSDLPIPMALERYSTYRQQAEDNRMRNG